jgi:hypothetical protein
MFHSKKNQLSVRLLAIAAILLSPCAANAATAGDISAAQVLNTSPVRGDSQSYHTCNVVNVSTVTISVAAGLINSTGAVLTSHTFSLSAGNFGQVTFNGGGYTGFARCRFTLNYSATNYSCKCGDFSYSGQRQHISNIRVFRGTLNAHGREYAVSASHVDDVQADRGKVSLETGRALWCRERSTREAKCAGRHHPLDQSL